MDNVVALRPKERVRQDAEPIATIYRNLGTSGAEQVVTRALGELALTMAGLATQVRAHEMGDLTRQLRRLQRMAENLGHGQSLGVVSGDLRACMDGADTHRLCRGLGAVAADCRTLVGVGQGAAGAVGSDAVLAARAWGLRRRMEAVGFAQIDGRMRRWFPLLLRLTPYRGRCMWLRWMVWPSFWPGSRAAVRAGLTACGFAAAFGRSAADPRWRWRGGGGDRLWHCADAGAAGGLLWRRRRGCPQALGIWWAI